MEECGRTRGNVGRNADSWKEKIKVSDRGGGDTYIYIYFISVRAPFSDKDAALMVL